MPKAAGAFTEKEESPIGRYIGKTLYWVYFMLLFVSSAILIVGTYMGNFMEVFIALPVIIILLSALIVDRTTVHIPPILIFAMVGLMFVIIVGNFFNDSYATVAAVNYLFGVVLGLAGMIITFSFTMTHDLSRERPLVVVFVSISVALSLFMVLTMIHYYLGQLLGLPVDAAGYSVTLVRTLFPGSEVPAQTMGDVMDQLIFVLLGAMTISAIFSFGRNSKMFRRLVKKYMLISSATIGVEEYERQEIKKALDSGENEKVEYKSTLRLNLGTGENDDRIERETLKAIVALLNSKGGTVLIGVADNGTVIGVDGFDNRDRLCLHLTNIIGSHIGNEFLPFITLRVSEYKGMGVMRVICKKSDNPVFLRDGKKESFYVRSGPSSVELTGKDTLNYVDNRFKKGK